MTETERQLLRETVNLILVMARDSKYDYAGRIAAIGVLLNRLKKEELDAAR